MMKPEIKAAWTAALSSGDYAQGREMLVGQDEDGNKRYCCLGVLQALYPNDLRDAGDGEYLDHNDAEAFCGMDFSVQSDLAAMNDEGASFTDIADYINEHL